MIAIVDYGAGNIFSVQNMFKKIGVETITASDTASIEDADKLILPGVGAFDACVQKLQASGLQQVLHKKVMEDKTPVLGICVGMQLMTEGSEEGVLPGLGWIKARTIRFNAATMPAACKIPHMGWAELQQQKPSLLLDGMYPSPRFYFVHSYYTVADNDQDVLAYARHGGNFTAAFEHGNIAAVQFHPEKSHKFGMKLLENFAKHF